MPNTYAALASEVFSNEFESNTGIATHSQISGWFGTHVGDLNVLLHQNYTGDNPALSVESSGIYKKMYMLSYYKKASRQALMGVLQDNGVLSISDVDYKITFTNRKEVAKEYQNLARDLQQEIQQDSYRFSMYESSPKQLGGKIPFSLKEFDFEGRLVTIKL